MANRGGTAPKLTSLQKTALAVDAAFAALPHQTKRAMLALAVRAWPVIRDRGADFEPLQALIEPSMELAFTLLMKWRPGSGFVRVLAAAAEAYGSMEHAQHFASLVRDTVTAHEHERRA